MHKFILPVHSTRLHIKDMVLTLHVLKWLPIILGTIWTKVNRITTRVSHCTDGSSRQLCIGITTLRKDHSENLLVASDYDSSSTLSILAIHQFLVTFHWYPIGFQWNSDLNIMSSSIVIYFCILLNPATFHRSSIEFQRNSNFNIWLVPDFWFFASSYLNMILKFWFLKSIKFRYLSSIEFQFSSFRQWPRVLLKVCKKR